MSSNTDLLVTSAIEESKKENAQGTKLDEVNLKPKIKLKRKEKQESKTVVPVPVKVLNPVDEVSKRFFESQRVA